MHLITTKIEHPAILETMKHLEESGYRVTYLKRIREINILIGDLKPGEYREITPAEEKELRRLVSGQVTKNERSY